MPLMMAVFASVPTGGSMPSKSQEWKTWMRQRQLGIISVVGAIATGVVAGANAVRECVGIPPVVLPETTMTGFFLKYANDRWDGETLTTRVSTYAGPVSGKAKEIGVYSEDKKVLSARIREHGLSGVFSQKIVE